MSNQITNTILMVRPAHFGFNAETAANNAFQTRNMALSGNEVAEKARQEFDALVAKLRSVGVDVIVIEDTDAPVKIDAIFPNNWFSTHENGTIITYPMFAPIRRLERREDVIELLTERFQYNHRIHLENSEADDQFLEGTGSIIMDRTNQVTYACRSIRTHEGLFDQFCKEMDTEEVMFDAVDESGVPIYHTNVMMAIGETFCVICLDSIKDEVQRANVVSKLKQTNKDIVDISFEQMNSFAGNMLQVRGENEQTYLVLSEQAFNSLTKQQIEQLESHTNLLHSPINTIEKSGGGSVRCMIAEIFYPK